VVNGFRDTVRVAGKSYTFKAGDHGSHQFTTALTGSGTKALTASDTSHPKVHSGSEGNITLIGASPALIADPANKKKKALVVIAPAGGTVVITPANAAGTSVTVTVNGKKVAKKPFAPTGHIYVWTQGGNTKVQEVSAKINGHAARVAIPA